MDENEELTKEQEESLALLDKLIRGQGDRIDTFRKYISTPIPGLEETETLALEIHLINFRALMKEEMFLAWLEERQLRVRHPALAPVRGPNPFGDSGL